MMYWWRFIIFGSRVRLESTDVITYTTGHLVIEWIVLLICDCRLSCFSCWHDTVAWILETQLLSTTEEMLSLQWLHNFVTTTDSSTSSQQDLTFILSLRQEILLWLPSHHQTLLKASKPSTISTTIQMLPPILMFRDQVESWVIEEEASHLRKHLLQALLQLLETLSFQEQVRLPVVEFIDFETAK